MRYQQDGPAIPLDLLDAGKTFALKRLVTDRQGFVDDQNPGIHAYGHRECQPGIHAAGIVLDRLVDEFADIGKAGNVIETIGNLLVFQPQHRCVHEHVLAASELRVEAGAEFQQRCHPALGLDGSLGRVQCTADHLQQRGFPGTIATNDAYRFAFGNLQRYTPKRPEFAVVLTGFETAKGAQARHDGLAQAILGVGIHLVALAQVLDPYGRLPKGHRRIPCAFSGTTRTQSRR